MFIVIVLQILVMVWAVSASEVMREEWLKLFDSPSDILVVKLPDFWGPVYAVVPKSCDEVSLWEHMSAKVDQGQDVNRSAWAAGIVDGALLLELGGVKLGNQSMLRKTLTEAVTDFISETLKVARGDIILDFEELAGVSHVNHLLLTWHLFPASREEKSRISSAISHIPDGKLCSAIEGKFTEHSANSSAENSETAFHCSVQEVSNKTVELDDASENETVRHPPGLTPDRFAHALFPWTGKNKAAQPIQLERCGKEFTFGRPGLMNRYLAMITFSNLFRKGGVSVTELHVIRKRSRYFFIASIAVCMGIKYVMTFIGMLSHYLGAKYVQLWLSSRTRFDRMLESLLLHGVTLVFTLTMQISLCTVYFTFWQGEHFVMSYIPGLSFMIFFGTLLALSFANLVDRLMGFSVEASDLSLWLFWILMGVWVALVTIPMMGTAVYSVQFLLEVRFSGVLYKEAMFSKRFEEAAHSATSACMCFLGLAIIDWLVLLRLDLEQHGRPNCVYQPVHPLGFARETH